MSSANQLKHKLVRRVRRKRHIRGSIFGNAQKPRLSVFRSHKNISCQLIDDHRGLTLAAASSLGKDLRSQLGGAGGNCKAAAIVGTAIAEKVKALGITSVQFDRNGYRFHGRVKALVEAARKAGLKV
jgi:large subunit ribosomal protein L18